MTKEYFPGRHVDPPPAQPARFYAPLKWLIGLVVITLMACAASALLAAPKARTPQECTIAADMAVSARAMAMHGLEREKADRLLVTMYEPIPGRGANLMLAITDAAYRSESVPKDFSQKLFHACMQNTGDMDSVLGKDPAT